MASPAPAQAHNQTGLGFWVGAWAGAALVALISIALDSSYEAQTLAGGVHLKGKAILIIAGIGAAVGAFIGASLGSRRPR